MLKSTSRADPEEIKLYEGRTEISSRVKIYELRKKMVDKRCWVGKDKLNE